MGMTMCGNSDKCKKKFQCYRNTRQPNEWRQAYMNFYKEGEECQDFVDNTNRH